jgi:hypothetical protein
VSAGDWVRRVQLQHKSFCLAKIWGEAVRLDGRAITVSDETH